MKINKHLQEIYTDIKKTTVTRLQCEFIKWFNSYQVNPLLSYVTMEDIKTLNMLATSPAMNCDVKEKYYRIGRLMEDRGFKLIGGGTNRRAFECVYDPRVVAKIATDDVGFTSNIRECVNQHVLKPFCAKTFESSPCGTLAISEKLVPIKTKEEFQKYLDGIFEFLFFKLRANSIGMEDIGTRSFKNYGYRNGFGPVPLDYPTMYVLDPNKRFCRNIVDGRMCGGTLDYDEGFNVIKCTECGKTYFARALAKTDGDEINNLLQAVGYQIKPRKEVRRMEFEIINSKGEVLRTVDTAAKSTYVNANGRRRYEKPTINLNDPQTLINQQPKKRDISFDVVRVDGNGNVKKDEDTDDSVSSPPVVTNTAEVILYRKRPTLDKLKEDFDHNLQVHGYGTGFIDSSTKSTEEIVNILTAITNHAPYADLSISSMTLGLFLKTCVATMIPPDMIGKSSVSINMTDARYYNDSALCSFINEIWKAYLNIDFSSAVDCYSHAFRKLYDITNAPDFFRSICAFFDTMLADMSIECDETFEYMEYKINKEVYTKYFNSVENALRDFINNVIYSGNMKYNARNSIIEFSTAISDISDMVKCDEVMGTINSHEFYKITIFDFDRSSIHSKIEYINENKVDGEENTTEEEETVVPESVAEEDTVVIPESVAEEIENSENNTTVTIEDKDSGTLLNDYSNDDTPTENEEKTKIAVIPRDLPSYNSPYVLTSGKPMSKKQNEKFNGKIGKKKHRR